MSDPKYPEYNGVLRFDDENVVEVGLEPDTENIKVKLNGTEVSGGGGAALPDVTDADNGMVLEVVDGVWSAAVLEHPIKIIDVVVDENMEPSTDVTYSDIVGYINKGIYVICRLSSSDVASPDILYLPLTEYVPTIHGEITVMGQLVFRYDTVGYGMGSSKVFMIDDGTPNTLTYIQNTYHYVTDIS